jgi:1-acyl-sn-glycerol-3-phosphate acyltransferase
MENIPSEFKYPRRRRLRAVLQPFANRVLRTLTNLEVIGLENCPRQGPLLVVANHFNFADPVALIAVVPHLLEFFAGSVRPESPAIVKWLPEVWKIYPVKRGSGSRYALKAAEYVMQQNGVLGIFPEGGAWAQVLRRPRPGTAYVAARTGAPILPVGLEGMPNIFPALRQGRRAKVTMRIGKPFGPFKVTGRGRERREQLDAIGDEIMQQIAALLPPQKQGLYSPDPAIRAAAEEVADYPWEPTADF